MTYSHLSERTRFRSAFAASLALLVCIGLPTRAAAQPSSSLGVGWISALVIDPQTPTTIYAATGCSGVFKSLDGTESWQHAGTGLPRTAVIALVIDPVTPATLYAGTEDGVYNSNDGGDSWSAAGLSGQLEVRTLALDPTTPSTIYAGGGSIDPEGLSGLYKSEDGGHTWAATGLNVAPVLAIAIDPATPTTVYAATSDTGVFKSTDGGNTWADTGLTDIPVFTLAIAPTVPPTLYAAAGRAPDAGFWDGPSLHRSTDGGSSWFRVLTTGVRGRILALAIDPTAPRTVYVGGFFLLSRNPPVLLKSRNAGGNWDSLLNQEVTGFRSILALAIDPVTPSTLYALADVYTEHTLFRSTDGGTTWDIPHFPAPFLPRECGDGILACEEQCDDGNLTDGDGCDSNCTVTACGNGVLNDTEECDDGNLVDGDGCDSNCTSTACGNGIRSSAEECDDGNRNPFDGCTANCTICGDGNVTAPEECDDANSDPSDGCTSACTICGNGVLTAPEGCDDGNLVNGDGCESYCAAPGCGNAFVEEGEDCDDGGICAGGPDAGTACTLPGQCTDAECRPVGGDGCAANCTSETSHQLFFDANFSEIRIGTSILMIPLPAPGSLILDLGRARPNIGWDEIPIAVRAAGLGFEPIPVSTLACLCIRGRVDPALPEGVSGSGTLGCAGPLADVDVMSSIDSYTSDVDPTCAEGVPGSFGCNGFEEVSFSGSGPAGSMRLDLHLESWSLQDGGVCGARREDSEYGADGVACTDDDLPDTDPCPRCEGPFIFLPPEFELRLTTGRASAEVLDANDFPGGDRIGTKADCPPHDTNCLAEVSGTRLDCNALQSGTIGPTLAGAVPSLDNEVLGDLVATFRLGSQCGNGVLDLDESCDDGNDSNEDACRNDCSLNVCGDGFRNPAAEECDDGNGLDDDCCSPACLFEPEQTECFDGNVCDGTGMCDGAGTCAEETEVPLDCDDGNEETLDVCRPSSGCFNIVPSTCGGDCDGSGDVTVDEILHLVNIALGFLPPDRCVSGDTNGDAEITVDEILGAVSRALQGCG